MKYGVIVTENKTRFSIGSRVFTLEAIDRSDDPEEARHVRESVAQSLRDGLKELYEHEAVS